MKSHAPFIITETEILNTNKVTRKATPQFEAELHCKVSDKRGNVKFDKTFPFRSFVSNFARILNYGFCNVANTGTITCADGGAPLASVHLMKVEEGALSSPTPSVYGIWVGNIAGNSGLTLNSPNSGIGGDPGYDDHILYNEIPADGDPAAAADTNLVYGATTTYIDSGTVLRVTRRFTNNNASAIKISEVGLFGSDGTDSILICRDKITDGTNAWVELASSDIIDISYKFYVTDATGYTKNFLRYLSSEFADGNTVENIVDTSGASAARDFTTARTDKDLMATATDDNFGILVGGSVNSVPIGTSLSANDYAVSGKLTNSQITHSAVTALNTSDITQEDQYSKFGVYRDFENEGTTPIYVNRAGLVIKLTSAAKYYLLSSVLVSGASTPYVVVQPGQILRIKYYFAFPLDTPIVPGIPKPLPVF